MKRDKSIVNFLRKLYEDDALISNMRVLQLIKYNFPNTHATQCTINAWKTLLRKEGCKIPFQRECGS